MDMKVITAVGVEELVRAQGGRLYVWPDHQRCCQGATYLLTSSDPVAGRDFRRIEGIEGFELWFDPGSHEPPRELHLDAKGWRRRRVEAYWDGCVFVT